jgi:hypothetical protein
MWSTIIATLEQSVHHVTVVTTMGCEFSTCATRKSAEVGLISETHTSRTPQGNTELSKRKVRRHTSLQWDTHVTCFVFLRDLRYDDFGCCHVTVTTNKLRFVVEFAERLQSVATNGYVSLTRSTDHRTYSTHKAFSDFHSRCLVAAWYSELSRACRYSHLQRERERDGEEMGT